MNTSFLRIFLEFDYIHWEIPSQLFFKIWFGLPQTYQFANSIWTCSTPYLGRVRKLFGLTEIGSNLVTVSAIYSASNIHAHFSCLTFLISLICRLYICKITLPLILIHQFVTRFSPSYFVNLLIYIFCRIGTLRLRDSASLRCFYEIALLFNKKENHAVFQAGKHFVFQRTLVVFLYLCPWRSNRISLQNWWKSSILYRLSTIRTDFDTGVRGTGLFF